MDFDKMTMEIEQHLDIKAPIDKVFESVIKQITDGMTYPDGRSMNMTLERKVGGRWYRDLGNGEGHLWGHIQTIKAPALLELTGPTCMSYPAMNHIDFRFSEANGGTHVQFRHRAFGFLDPMHRDGMPEGWKEMMDAVKKELEG